MSLSYYFSKLEELLVYFGMPTVTCYHLLCSNVFLNVAADDAKGLEKIGDVALVPFRYLFAGHRASLTNEENKYEIRQYFDYHEHFGIKTIGSILSLPVGVCLGSLLKGIAFLSSDVRERYHAIVSSQHTTHVISNRDFYRSVLIDIGENAIPHRLEALGFERRPSDEEYFSEEKKAFAQIISILKENGIPFWADCGTCLGAYRYGGIIPWDNDLDLAILQPDFANVKRALNALDPSLYFVEDWSNRMLPETYMRVYIRSTRQSIDIYTYAIHPERKTVQYICSNENNMFLFESWKVVERRYTVETPFDVVFPLRLADFDGIETFVPNKTEIYLQMRYGENLAPAKIYNADTGMYEKDLTHPYWQLSHVR